MTDLKQFDPNRPYNALPPLPPQEAADLDRLLTSELIAARVALAELKGVCASLPEPEILLNTVVLQESKESSEIEEVLTTQEDLFWSAASEASGGTPRPAAKEVLRYRQALFTGLAELDRTGLLTTNLLVRIVQDLQANSAGVRTSGDVFIGNPASGTRLYTPPAGEAVLREKLGELERFINDPSDTSGAIDPVIRMALIHYQFEAIHPFYDGNGRTGRILNVLYLVQQGLLDRPILYLSSYILRRRSAYYRLLRSVTTESAWIEWIRYILRGVTETAEATRSLVQAIGDLMEETVDTARIKAPNAYSRDLIRLIFRQPYCRIEFLMNEGIVASRATASKYLHSLKEAGILEEVQVHRDKFFVNRRLLTLLEEFGR